MNTITEQTEKLIGKVTTASNMVDVTFAFCDVTAYFLNLYANTEGINARSKRLQTEWITAAHTR